MPVWALSALCSVTAFRHTYQLPLLCCQHHLFLAAETLPVTVNYFPRLGRVIFLTYQYFSCNIRQEICSVIMHQTLSQTVLACSKGGGKMAAEPLCWSWRAKLCIDPPGSEDTVMSPLHLSVILSAVNDLAVRSGKRREAWYFFVSKVQPSALWAFLFTFIPKQLLTNENSHNVCQSRGSS